MAEAGQYVQMDREDRKTNNQNERKGGRQKINSKERQNMLLHICWKGTAVILEVNTIYYNHKVPISTRMFYTH